jgi:hypothetical protein
VVARRLFPVLATRLFPAVRRLLPVVARRLFPVLATAGLIAFGMASTIWWGPGLVGRHDWSLPHDLWGTLIAAHRLLRLDMGGLYTRPTSLVTFPGAAVIMVPVVAVINAARLSLAIPGPHNSHPGAWLLAGPYEIAVSAVALFAADALADHLGVPRPRRALLAAAEAAALWSVSVRWGHPEDAVAVGLFVFAILALARSRVQRAAWLTGAAVAVQPLVLLALPVAVAVIERRRAAGFLTRAAVPGAVLLGAAAAANWKATVHAVTSQPNWPTVDHPTPWMSLTPHLSGGAVAAGPARALAVLAACGCALAARHQLRAAWHAPAEGRVSHLTAVAPGNPPGWDPRAAPRNPAGWDPGTLRQVLWLVAVALAFRCVFEPVIVAYYLWPALAVALIAASVSWRSLAATSFAATAVTLASQLSWHGLWSWWCPMIAGLALTLFAARTPPLCARMLPGHGSPATRAALYSGSPPSRPNTRASLLLALSSPRLNSPPLLPPAEDEV